MRKYLYMSLAVMFIFVAGFIGINVSGDDDVQVINGHNNYIDDFTDKRKLVGASHNVFVGKVIEETDQKSLDGTPETQFSVKVLQNIKGNLNGNVTVNQQGGFYEKEGKKYLLIYNEDELLVPGETYLFATRYLESQDWHTLINKFGDLKIDDEAQKAQLIKEFASAYKYEIIPEALKNKDNYNNRGQLSKEDLEKNGE